MPVPLPPIGGAGGAGGGGGAPGAPGVPGALNLPKSPVGGSPGPGASPMLSPGDGAGMQAHVESGLRETVKTLVSYLGRIPPGSKLFKTLARAVESLNAAIGAPQDMSGAPKPPAPVGNMPPVGVAGRPPGIPPGGMGGATPNPLAPM